MRRFAPATVVATLLLIATQSAMALGLGRVNTLSHLGSALEFTVALSAEPGDALAPECIHADVYAGDSRVPPQLVRVRVNRGADGTPTSLRVVTGTRIDEPVATVQLRLDCGTRVSRNYTVFIDPPVLDLATSEAPSTPVAAAAPVPPSTRAPSTTRRASRPAARDPGRVQAGGTGSASSAARQRRAEQAAATRAARAAREAARAEARNEAGSRLRLESAPPTTGAAPVRERRAGSGTAAPGAASAAAGGLAVARAPAVAAAAAPATSAPGSAAAASAAGSAAGLGGLIGELAARADSDALALQAEQLRALERRFADLNRQNQSMQKTVAELQARLAEAEANRYANPLVYALIGLLVLLLAAIAALLWRQRQIQQESDWLKAASAETAGERPAPEPRSIVRPSTAAPAPVARTAAAAAASAGLGGAETVSGVRARSAAEPPAVVVDPPAPAAAAVAAAALASAAPRAAPAAADRTPHEATSVHDPRREVTVEELIDLEQQADFFVVLGQDDAAIDLLMGHVQGTGGASPLPYLKLLEIHRRRDDRVAYDRVRERFNRRFSAYAPEWESHSGHDRSLEDYPAIVNRLQGLWPRPVDAMEALEGLLFQRDAGAETFDLTAYGELLFLYSLARELSESEPPPDGVDLLLPLDDGPSPGGSGGAGLPRLGGAAALGAAGAVAAGAAMTADPQRLADLDVGLSLAPQDDAPTLPLLPDVATYPAPLGLGGNADEPLPDLNLDEGLLDLNISDEPEEPKGPLSKY